MRRNGIKINAITISKILLGSYLVYNCALVTIGFYIPRLSIILLLVSAFSVFTLDGIRFRPLRFKEMEWLLLFAVYSSLSGLLVANNRPLVLQQILFLIELLFVAYLICIVTYKSGEADIIPWSFLISAVILSVFMLRGRAVVVGTRLTLTEGYNSNTLGVFLMFGGWGLLKVCGKMKHFAWSLILSAAGAAILFYFIIRTGSRKATIGFVAILAMWIIFVFRAKLSQVRRSVRILSILTLIAAIALIAPRYGSRFVLAGDTIAYRMQDLGNSEGSWTIRLALIRDALGVFVRNPVFGVGLNNYRLYSAYEMYSHNTYAEVLACTGLIGGILFFGLLVMLIKTIFSKAFHDIKYKQDKVESAYYVTLLIVFLVICMTQICIYNRNLMLVLTQMIAAAILTRRNKEIEEATQKTV